MPIDASTVAMAFKTLLGRALSEADATDLAATLGSREELLAYLLTRKEFLGEHPDAREELLRVAAQHGLEAQTRRSDFGPTATMHSLNRDLRSEALKVVAESALSDSTAQMDDLVHRLSRLSFFQGAPPEFSPERWIKP